MAKSGPFRFRKFSFILNKNRGQDISLDFLFSTPYYETQKVKNRKNMCLDRNYF